ncbi:MAG: HPr family phosphocarrier protein [Pseudolabrys sp.]|nr:HPr family phosphocarrier protein [Pseudolabrys sp.]
MTGSTRDGHADEHAVAVTRDVEIINKKGLHARASAKFVQHAEKFDAAIIVTRGHEFVGGTSIMGLMMLAAGPGTTITIKATGKEAAKAVADLVALVSDRFGEEE